VPRHAARKQKTEAEDRAAAAEAELQAVREQLGSELVQLRTSFSRQLQDVRSGAEERVQQHTDMYRAQVATPPCPPILPQPIIALHYKLCNACATLHMFPCTLL
jgi:hypothetical protein